MKTILAPVDFSAASDAVVTEAAALARALQGRVVFLNVVQPPVTISEYAPLVPDVSEMTAACERFGARELEKLEARLATDFVTVESVQLVGAPIPLIVEEAEKIGADYIVMGSHGHTALYDLLVGSTTHGVLLRAKCPVVIVPALKEPKPLKRAKSRAALV
jgi:nucleotide-binding universal stress UspA family protein